jgi:signal transduction histidine kinase
MWTRKSRDTAGKSFSPRWLNAFAHRITTDLGQLFQPRSRPRTREDPLAEAGRACTELLEQVEQLARLASEADLARGAAEEAHRANSEFLAVMSHELRNALNGIIGYIGLLEMGIDGALSSEQQNYIGRLRVITDHLQGLINNVLDFSKIEAGQMIVSSERHYVRAVVSDALGMVRPHASDKGLELVDACAPGLEYIGDEIRVRQILMNLLSNAVKFTPQGGRVTIRAVVGTSQAGAGGALIALTVEDTGVGISPEEKELVFEPYVQTAGVKKTGRGTGLGLPISRRLARLMGGNLTLESELGHGSSFTLWLPMAA